MVSKILNILTGILLVVTTVMIFVSTPLTLTTMIFYCVLIGVCGILVIVKIIEHIKQETHNE